MPGLYGNVGNTTVSGGNTTSLYNTSTYVTVSNNINVNDINASGNLFVAGTGTFGGNVTAPNFIGNLTGNVSGNISGNVVAPGSNTQVIYNDSGSLGADPDFTWNESTNTLTVTGAITATGNVSGAYILGNGSQLTGLPATYGNADVQNYLANGFGSNTIVTTGNISAGYFLGNGSQLTGIVSSYGNANVAAYLPTYTGNLAGGNLAIGNNATINNDLTVGGTIFGTFSGNISGNLVVPGANTQVIFNNAGNAGASSDFTFNDATNVMTVNGTANVGVLNATGNVTGDYFFGNAAFMSGIPATYGNANVAAYLPTYTGNIAAGNLTAATTGTGNLQVDGNIALTKTPEARISGSEDLRIFAAAAQDLYLSNPSMPMANIWLDAQDIRLARTLGGSDTNVIVTGQITTTGNVTGANIIGNGQYLTSLPGANVTGTVANATYATSAGSATTATHATTANTVTDAAQGNITSLGTLTALTVGGDQNITGNLIVGQNLTVNGNTIQVNITELNVQDPIIGLGRGENNAPLTSNDGKDRGEQLWYYAGSEKSAFTGYDNSAGNLILATDVAIANEIVTVTAWGTTETGDLYAHGNITGDYVFGNAAFMTGIPAQYGNANVADFLDSFGSNAIVTTGNVTAGYFFGDGSGLTNINAGNIVGSYGNANVANFLANYGSNTIVTTGNISGGNVIGTFLYGDGTNITGVVAGAASTRIEVKNTSGVTITKGTPVYATGTVGASTIIEIAASRADTASTMPCLGLLAQDLNNNDQGYAISVGTLTSTNTNGFTTGQELYVAAAGGLTASRPTGTNIVQTVGIVGRVNASNGSIEVNVWNVNSLPNLGNGNVWIGNANGFPTQQVAYGDANVAAYLPTYTGNLAGGNITVTGVYYGNGSGLTSLTGANVTGTVANATYATSAGSAGTATTAVTVTGNAQANITSVGTLTTLTVSGNIGTGGILTDNYYYANGTPISFGGTYGNANVSNFLANGFGSNTITTTGNITSGNIDITGVLFNSANANVTIQDNVIVVGNLSVSNLSRVNIGTVTLVNDSGSPSSLDIQATSVDFNGLITTSQGITATGNIQGSYFIGNGSQLTGILTSPLSANLDTNNFSIVNSAGANVSIADDLNVSGNIYTGSLKSVWVGSVEMLNNSGAPAGIIIRGGVEVDGNINVKGATINQGNVFIEDAAGVLFADADNSNYIGLKGPSVTAANVTFTLPNADGGSGQVLSTYGNGVMYWQSTTSGYGNANVSNFLANGFGSNTIVTTGNIDANNFNATTSVRVSGSAGNISGANYVIANYFSGNGSQLTGINSFATIDANGTSIVADSISDTLTLVAGTNITITGNAAADSITISATGGGGSPGGSDTQIQFNDGGAFAGNAQMTFSKVTGNAAFGNLVIQTTNPNNAAVITNVNALNASARPLLARIAIGSGFNGDFGNTGDYLNTTRNSAVALMNRFDQSSTSNTTPMIGTSAVTWFNNTSGNTITSAGNARGMSIDTFYTGSRWGTAGGIGAAAYNGLRIHAIAGNGSSAGNVATLAGLNLTTGTAGSNSTINDNINLIINQIAAVSGANNGNVYGVTFNMNSSNPTVGNTYLIHNQAASSGTHNSNWGIGGNFRSASRYFFIRNDDDVSQVKLGSLRNYHEFLGSPSATSGAVTINPRSGSPNGQVLRTVPTGNITSVTFAGFITTASDGVNTDNQVDTVTWIIQQGATPYTVTMPTGNTAIKYAGGVSTVGATANAVTMCSITAYDNSGTTNYLVTISPEFT